MTIQNINLYLPELQPKKEWLTAEVILLSLVAMMLVFAGLTVLNASRLERLQAQQDVMQGELEGKRTRVVAFSSNLQQESGQRLDQEIQKLRNAIAASERIGHIMQHQTLGNDQGFSDMMLALARQHESELSLDKFRLREGGAVMEMAGNSKSTSAVPRYLEALQQDSALSDTRYGFLTIEESQDKKAHRFRIGYREDKLHRITGR